MELWDSISVHTYHFLLRAALFMLCAPEIWTQRDRTPRLLRLLIIINLPVLILCLICGKRLRGLNAAGTARICEGRCDCMGALSDIRPVHKSMYEMSFPNDQDFYFKQLVSPMTYEDLWSIGNRWLACSSLVARKQHHYSAPTPLL